MKFGPELAEVISLTTQPYVQVSIKSLCMAIWMMILP